MEQFLFTLYALFACGGAIAVVLSQNVVRMAFYLVVSLGSTAALFFLLGADFIGATQLLIYVGGTVVLLIFGVMLTSSSPLNSIKNTPAELLQGGAVGLAFLAVVFSTVLSVDWQKTQQTLAHASPAVQDLSTSGFNANQEGNTSRSIGTALLGVRFDRDLKTQTAAEGHTHTDGDVPHSHDGHMHTHTAPAPATLSTGYLLPFEIVSVHLLVVLVGASYLARAKRPRPATAS